MNDLEALFCPSVVAVVGASSDTRKISGKIVRLLGRHEFKGRVYPVNPNRDTIVGVKAYPSLDKIPEKIDVCFIYLKPQLVPECITLCGQAGVAFAVILSGGFAELGEEGERLQMEVSARAQEGGVRVVGPNCAGLASVPNSFIGYGTTSLFEADMIPAGPISLISQSGGMGNTVMSLLFERSLGVSRVVSSGNEMDIGLGDYIQYLAHDEKTSTILVFAEGFRDLPSVLRTVETATGLGKRVVVLRTGRTTLGQTAAASHTGALARDSAVVDAALRHAGAILVEDLSDLVDQAVLTTRAPALSGRRVGIFTLPGGAAALTSDLVAESGMELAHFDEATTSRLRQDLPPVAVVANPVDPTADVLLREGLVASTLKIVADDENVDVCVVLPHVGQRKIAEDMAAEVVSVAARTKTPIVALWPADDSIRPAWEMIDRGGVALFTSPRACFRELQRACEADHVRDLLRGGSEPLDLNLDREEAAARAAALIKANGPGTLSESVSKQVLAAYGVPVTRDLVVEAPPEAVGAAAKIGYPVAVKILSSEVAHKSDLGLVQLGISNESDLRSACESLVSRAARHGLQDVRLLLSEMVGPSAELMLGARTRVEGCVALTVGLGGTWVEMLGDVSIGVAPVGSAKAQLMLGELRHFRQIEHGWRGLPPVSSAELVALLCRLSALAEDLADVISEIDVNPVMVGPRGLTAVDALVVAS
ncbi:hypothetical protein CFI00_17195 [Nocardioides sp. S5]|uniref:acetate--CoA ligase family protein n=1 Tax=Nocardioides sp. S5 TaxID=2017486 RepID=UPI001A8F859D|nr:acetate--CoA ligase family protein [Nocardioides sp. S5]QSR32199.1 hypothetical protein CFI00_17195 [Nocardioides sp. S5]